MQGESDEAEAEGPATLLCRHKARRSRSPERRPGPLARSLGGWRIWTLTTTTGISTCSTSAVIAERNAQYAAAKKEKTTKG